MGGRGVSCVLLLLCTLLATCSARSTWRSITGRSSRTAREVRSRTSLCDGKADNVLYPHPHDCRRYVLCTGNYEYVAACQPGLFYDHDLQACNFDEHGACEAEVRRKTSISKVTSFESRPTSGAAQPAALNSGRATVTSEDGFCKNKADGTYVDDTDCHKYRACSNGRLHVSVCPNDLIYRADIAGCDFDRDGQCTAGRGNTPANFNNRPQAQTDITLKAEQMMPEAVEKAMSALIGQLKEEAALATRASRTDRPFSLVQNLQKGKEIVKQMSMNAFILSNATNEVLKQLGMSPTASTVDMMRSVTSPLAPNTDQIRPDDKVPKVDPGTCPYPAYTCSLTEYRSFDGSCNNLANPLWGRSFTPLTRNLDPKYGDGLKALRVASDGSDLPSPRAVSAATLPDKDVPHHIHTVMLMQWGQFTDHDFSLTAITKMPQTPTGTGKPRDLECGDDGCTLVHEACVPIVIADADPDFAGSGKKCLEFVRSEPVPNTACKIGPREQLNMLTSYIDASLIYGSTKEEADGLRDTTSPDRGKLRVALNPLGAGLKDFLPSNTDDAKCLERQATCYLAGDERVNEQTALTALHAIWLREHNRIEEELHAVNPHWDGDRLYQETRKLIAAYNQIINYSEFLPVVLGPGVMQTYGLDLLKEGFYTGYDSTVDAGVSNVFASTAFRFGHSMLTPTFTRQNADYTELNTMQLSEMFFKPSRLLDPGSEGVDGLLRGLCNSRIQRIDKFITKEVTKNLFSKDPPNGLGADLASLNIQRARDHGVPGYNAWRTWCGLSTANTFEDLSNEIPDATARNTFRQLYKSVDDIDLFPAALSESSLDGSLLGPTFACILGRDFARLRKGDRFWHENEGQFTTDQLAEIRKVRLSKIICDNSDNITLIQPAVMELPFRDAYPDPSVFTAPMHGMATEQLLQLWNDDYNKRVKCSAQSNPDFSKWKE